MRRTLAAVITAAMVGVVLWVVFHPILGPAPPAPTEPQTAEPPAAVTTERSELAEHQPFPFTPDGVTSVSGRVVNSAGQPIAATGTVRGDTREARSGRTLGYTAVSIQSTGEDNEPRPMLRFGQTSHSDGTFELSVPAGSYRLQIERDGFADEWRAITVAPGQALLIELPLYAAGHLAFTVESPEPDLPRRLTVETHIVGNPQTTVTSPHFGQSFSVMRLRRGELYDVTISAEGYRPHRGIHRVVGGDGDPIRVVLAR